jgi:hypothetical protein
MFRVLPRSDFMYFILIIGLCNGHLVLCEGGTEFLCVICMKAWSEVLGMERKCRTYPRISSDFYFNFTLNLWIMFQHYRTISGFKVLAPEILKVSELFRTIKMLWFVAECHAKFHTKSGRIFIIAYCPFTWMCNNITAISKRLLHVTAWQKIKFI